MPAPIITLLTDFGRRDHYVATMKGVMLTICPQAELVDISHDVQPQAIRQAAHLLASAAPFFPPGTVHLAIVDPGVGTERRAIAVGTARACYVGPDNGLFGLVLEREPVQWAVHLNNPEYHLAKVSATFHGRDIFAPAAAHIACGQDPDQMGDALTPFDLHRIEILKAYEPGAGPWQACVLHTDRFGNLITNLQVPDPDADLALTVAGHQIDHLSRTFADVAVGELVAYIGSSGLLEIAVRQGNAAKTLGTDLNSPVHVEEQG
ncbi:MAG: S-adenosyl-l-methionine hydroxide adenosyltransferase family protein [Anaerolineae bacterium]|jgi:S-adenosylmethionine hydrolase